ncbi:hypothetical protein AWJ20_4422 [Sugiyamaella lignohabitans]|uniref:RAVE subunit 2/Rogdi n=1 Tax=Sugiyamaella lignohabitans TaxID=796027 RepID=A0A161HG06_9ASCO|nr:uncharacterized protein AWJ20_4422 [Sugiyamaella lignohabitans]ANB11601.1 hypothetical protein AWJ20_4422 [Sugiyamaella lignohabitans]
MLSSRAHESDEETMTTTIEQKEQEAQKNELRWLLEEIHLDVKSSVIVGIEECLSRLCDRENAVKLVMSSSRRETVKGTVDRVGTYISECDMLIKLPSANKGHPFPIRLGKDPIATKSGTSSPTVHPTGQVTESKANTSYPLIQLVDTVNFLDEALSLSQQLTIDCQALSKEGHSHSHINTQMGLGQLLGLVKNALSTLHEPKPSSIYPQRRTDRTKFSGLPAGVAVDFYLIDSNVITDIRAYEDIDDPSTSPVDAFGAITSMLSIGKKKHPPQIIKHGDLSIIEHERVRIESQDPNLISVTTKLTALEALLESIVRKLQLCT